MFSSFAEGVRSIPQACHLVILVPVAMAVLAGRARRAVVVGAVTGIALGGWLFATRWLVLDDAQIRWSSLIVAGSIGLLMWRSWRLGPTGPAEPWILGGIAALLAVVVTSWWRPCVGEQLGDILTRAPEQPWGQLLPTVGFMLGVSVPIVALGLAMTAWAPSAQTAGRVALASAGVGGVLSVSVLAGQHGEIVSRLFAWSEPFV